MCARFDVAYLQRYTILYSIVAHLLNDKPKRHGIMQQLFMCFAIDYQCSRFHNVLQIRFTKKTIKEERTLMMNIHEVYFEYF